MAEDKKNGNGATCMCGCHGGMMGGHWTFFLLRTILTILILMMVFWFGVQVGRMNGGFGFEREMMTRSGYSGMYINPGGPMMPVREATSTTTGVPTGY